MEGPIFCKDPKSDRQRRRMLLLLCTFHWPSAEQRKSRPVDWQNKRPQKHALRAAKKWCPKNCQFEPIRKLHKWVAVFLGVVAVGCNVCVGGGVYFCFWPCVKSKKKCDTTQPTTKAHKPCHTNKTAPTQKNKGGR